MGFGTGPQNFISLSLKLMVMTMITRSHSSRMHTARLPTIRALVAIRCQYWWRTPQINKFEEVCSDGCQVSLVGAWGRGPHVPCLEEGRGHVQ